MDFTSASLHGLFSDCLTIKISVQIVSNVSFLLINKVLLYIKCVYVSILLIYYELYIDASLKMFSL